MDQLEMQPRWAQFQCQMKLTQQSNWWTWHHLLAWNANCLNEEFPTSLLWDNSTHWKFDRDIQDDWINEAAPALAHAIVSAISIIDFEYILIDGWFPDAVRDKIVKQTDNSLRKMNLSGLSIPKLLAGTVGADARALGAASLPLSHRYLPIQ